MCEGVSAEFDVFGTLYSLELCGSISIPLKMSRRYLALLFVAAVILVAGCMGGDGGTDSGEDSGGNPTAVVVTNKGTFKFELYAERVPTTVENFVGLAEDGFYDGLTFHRYEPGFVIQGGDPRGDGTGDWETLALDHSDYFPLTGDHRISDCTECHRTQDFTDWTCYSDCHHEHTRSSIRMEHSGEGIRNYENCLRCHPDGREHDD